MRKTYKHSPLSHYTYVRSGGVYPNSGTLEQAGISGYDWSRIVAPGGAYAYFLGFGEDGLGHSSYSVRFSALLVRSHFSKHKQLIALDNI